MISAVKCIRFTCFLIGATSAIHASANSYTLTPKTTTGSNNSICVAESSKVGDLLKSPSGNTATIKALIGPSSSCKSEALPVQAEVEFTSIYSSQATVNLSNEYELLPISKVQRFNSTALLAKSKTVKDKNIFITVRVKHSNNDLTVFANNIEKIYKAKLKDAITQNSEKINIQGLSALRFEVSGLSKDAFPIQTTYLITVIEGVDSLITINTYMPSAEYAANKSEMLTIGESFKDTPSEIKK